MSRTTVTTTKLGEYWAEPIYTGENLQNDVIYLNTHRDVQSAPDFFYSCPDSTKTCTSLDPRLIDPVRNIRMDLDRPPLQPRNVQPLQHIYDDCNAGTIRPQIYHDGYKSMYAGDYTYWIDKTLAQVYNDPVYAIKTAVIPFVFQDPMGSLKPQYDRAPLFKDQNNIATYTFDQDQMSFREDLIERQSRVMNQMDYNIYYGHFRNFDQQQASPK